MNVCVKNDPGATRPASIVIGFRTRWAPLVLLLALLFPERARAADDDVEVFLLDGPATVQLGHGGSGRCDAATLPEPPWTAFEVASDFLSSDGEAIGVFTVCGNQQPVTVSGIREDLFIDIVERGELGFDTEDGTVRVPYKGYDVRVAQLYDGGNSDEATVEECSAAEPCSSGSQCLYPLPVVSPDNLRMTSVHLESSGPPLEATDDFSEVIFVRGHLIFHGFADTRVQGTVLMVTADDDDDDDDWRR